PQPLSDRPGLSWNNATQYPSAERTMGHESLQEMKGGLVGPTHHMTKGAIRADIDAVRKTEIPETGGSAMSVGFVVRAIPCFAVALAVFGRGVGFAEPPKLDEAS